MTYQQQKQAKLYFLLEFLKLHQQLLCSLLYQLIQQHL